MLREGGMLIVTRDDGKVNEFKTFTCFHCSKIVVLRPGGDLGGGCGICRRNICGPCVDLGSCTPFEKKLEEEERAYDRRRMWAAFGIGGV